MKRGIFDLLRRGLDSTLANWQLALIRFLEAFLFMALAVGAVLVILVPIFVSVGVHLSGIDSPEEIESAVAALLTKWVLLLWIVLGISVLLLVCVAVHSFVSAGSARVFVDADRVAGPELNGPRLRYRVFSMDRWLTGGRDGWWTVFWIYNLVWGLAGLLMLLPLLPTLALILLFHEQEGLAVVSGCLGLLAALLFMIVVGFVANIWSNRAVVAWAAHRTGAGDSMRIGWQAIRSDPARHLLTALAVVVVAMAGSMFFASFSFFAGFGEAIGRDSGIFMLMTLPMRLAGTLLNSAFSALLGSWYVATYAALAMDPVRR